MTVFEEDTSENNEQAQMSLSEEKKNELLEYTYFSDISEKVTADDMVNLRDIPSQDLDNRIFE